MITKISAKDDKTAEKAFRNFFNIYLHELSKYNPLIARKMSDEAIYMPDVADGYFDEASKSPIVLYKNDRPIGFVVISTPTEEDHKDGCDYYIEEIFMSNVERGKGITSELCRELWREKGGTCGLCVLKKNYQAEVFWERLFTSCGYKFTKSNAEDMWFYKFKIQ